MPTGLLRATVARIDVAVAYGLSSERMIDGKPYKSYFADYYVWKDGQWRVYFAADAVCVNLRNVPRGTWETITDRSGPKLTPPATSFSDGGEEGESCQ